MFYVYLQENLAKRKILLKQGKMPELAETSETESLKGGCNGSMEVHQEGETGKTAEASKGREVFPSISDDMLTKLKLKFKKNDQK